MNDNQHIPSGYKPSPLGIIPKEWEVKRLGECTNLLTNGFVGVATPHYTEDSDGITYIQGYNVTEGGFNLRGIKKVTKEFHKKNSKSSLLEGDLLTIQTGDIGLTTIVPKDLEGSNCHALIISRFNNSIIPRFMLYYYNSSIGRERFRKIETGTTMKHINTGDLINFLVPVPSIEEQKAIVDLLKLWNTAIAKQTALIEQLTLRKRGLMQQLLTGKKRLKGFEGGWKRIKAGEIFKSISVKGNGSEVLLSATQEHGVIPRDQLEGRVTMPTGDTNSFKLVEVGDFVISLRSFQGGLEYSEHRGIVSPAYTVLKPIVEIDKSFYRYYFKSAEFIGHLAIAVIGIRDGKQISYEDFCFVKIPYPNIEEQKAISTVLLQADKEIEIQKQKLAAMQEQKKGLMQVLLTGKRRINQQHSYAMIEIETLHGKPDSHLNH